LLDLLGILALVSYGLINGSAIPRIRKVWKDQSTAGVSIFGSFMIWVGCLIIFLYFISVGEAVGSLGGGLNSTASGAVWMAQLYYRRKYER
jgi:uncharacterized protein with PQ loop repeat